MHDDDGHIKTSWAALCSDFYINQKLALKLDLPTARDTVLHLFDRVRRELPMLNRFRRFEDELALESDQLYSTYCWLALQQTSIRSGWVNPDGVDAAYRLHRLLLDLAPAFLSISPMDVDYLELVYGFDLDASGNRNEIIFDALLADSPLAGMVDGGREAVLDAQPLLGIALNDSCELQAFVEVKSRTRAMEISAEQYDDQPISVYLTVRQYAAMHELTDMASAFGTLAGYGERLCEQRVLPHVVVPIRRAILSSPE